MKLKVLIKDIPLLIIVLLLMTTLGLFFLGIIAYPFAFLILIFFAIARISMLGMKTEDKT